MLRNLTFTEKYSNGPKIRSRSDEETRSLWVGARSPSPREHIGPKPRYFGAQACSREP